jgi:large subunit ribosomal protein L17
MNKKVFGRKLSRSRPAREALFASLAKALIENGKIVTTRAKAKAVQGSIEKMVTSAKKGDLSSRRRVTAELDNARKHADILFQNVAKAFSARQSGFTRIVSLPSRVGDRAKMARLEWTDKVEIEGKAKAKKAEVKKEVKKAVKKEVKK